MSEQLLVGNSTIVTMDDERGIIENGAVLCEDGIIKKIGKTVDLLKEYPGTKYLDTGGMIVMPGMINAHHHLYSTFARGMALKNEPPENFTQILERLWWRLDNALSMEDIYVSALVPLIDGLKRGTTCIIDHHASQHTIPGSLDEISKAAMEVGVRHCLCYETSDRWGEEIARQGIEENERFIKRCKENPDDMRAAAFGLHASFTVSEKTLEKCMEITEKYGAIFHSHVAEDKADVDDSMEKYGMPILKRFEKSGALDNGFLAIHCIHINEEEEDIIKNKGVMVVHNPESNMNNGVGCARVPEFLEKGLVTGLGTDGFTSD
ncbi:MAG: amidohydrolase family protein, partial [Candidatus Eremiobacteraeota bacterium]|nr:amidohydrolase family protein [Candidatus Eremiobacteraeota bacterium]